VNQRHDHSVRLGRSSADAIVSIPLGTMNPETVRGGARLPYPNLSASPPAICSKKRRMCLEGASHELWCGHGPWHHQMYPYPPPYPPPGYYYPPPPFQYGTPPGRRRRRAADAEELADYLQQLEEEIASVRRDLDDLRRSDTPER
jgi:hypothetical protein